MLTVCSSRPRCGDVVHNAGRVSGEQSQALFGLREKIRATGSSISDEDVTLGIAAAGSPKVTR